MKRLSWKIFYFIFKPILPALLVTYFTRVFTFPLLICVAIFILFMGLDKNNNFYIFIASIILLLIILLFLLTIFMNKDKYLMKLRKGVIIKETPYNDNLLNGENYRDENDEDEDKYEDDDNDNYKDINNERMSYIYLLELISAFWFWVLFYGIYAYYVNKEWYPFKIAFIMFVVNIICNFIIKKHKK